MVKQLKFNILLFLFIGSSLICLNLSHAQTTSNDQKINQQIQAVQSQIKTNPNGQQISPANPQTNPLLPTTGAGTGTVAVPPSTNPDGTLINSNNILNTNSSTGKFAEFMSICRTREFDNIKFQGIDQLTEKLKELRSQVAAQKNAKASESTVEAFQLLSELIDAGALTEFNTLSTALKIRYTNEQDINWLNGLISLSKKNYRDARTSLLKALVEDEKNEDLLKILAEVFKLEKNYYEASAIYEDLNAVKKNAYLAELCETMVLNSLNADGEQTCLLAARKFPDNPYPFIFAGITMRERQSLKRARDLFAKSINIRPTEMGNICMAEMSLLENKPAEAVQYFKLSVEQSPNSPRAVLGLAWAQMKTRSYDGALETFKKACASDKKYEVEVRKAYKMLIDEKSPAAEKFMRIALRCIGS